MNTSSFLSTLMAVLNEQTEIEGLPNDRLNASTSAGSAIDGEVPARILHKVARLQTLIVQIREKSQIPDYETTRQIAEETGTDFITAGANALSISEDSTHQSIMIERLIIEIVREAFPKEREQFNVRYFARLDGKIIRLPQPNRRFLD